MYASCGWWLARDGSPSSSIYLSNLQAFGGLREGYHVFRRTHLDEGEVGVLGKLRR